MDKVLLALFFTMFKVAFSWIVTCGFIYLIMFCFGTAFSWTTATGIWLSLVLASIFLKSSSSNKDEK